MIAITFPDGTKKQLKKGITGLEIANSISEGLGRAAIAIKVNDELLDLYVPIEKNAKVQIITFKDKEGKGVFWHSASHLMTQAVLRVFKDQDVGLGVGFAIENGFYQDYDMKPIHPDDLEKIEAEMKKIVKEKLDIRIKDVSKKEALKFYKKDPYKTEMIGDVPGDSVKLYCQGELKNLCKGPHVPNTKILKSFKLMKIAGAYWRGDANKPQLQRIYGIAFPDKKELKQYLHLLEEAEKRDHRKIGKELDLFSFHEEGPGFPFLHPKGMDIWNELLDYWREEHRNAGYVETRTPVMLHRSLWEQSGHWENYRENMYTTHVDDQDFAIKPMNCPGGMLVYKEKVHSYKEFPLKVGEIGLVHRHELSGVLSGMFRVRSFHQDDAHIFMEDHQIQSEVIRLMKLIDKMYKMFGFEYNIELSTRPEKRIGNEKLWDNAEEALQNALEKSGFEFQINEGDGAFYGPKIDYHLKDAIGRTWQCGTIQLDMALPERFELEYDGKDGKKHRPVMLHRTIYGGIERFFGILIEHYAGKFPLWLSPNQVKILPIADRHMDYAKQVHKKLFDAGIRVEIDDRAESTNKKVRDAQTSQFNYILVVGDKEAENDTINIRTRDNVVHGEKDVRGFLAEILDEIKTRK
jgi:threonyl-tRNA synthetase